MKRQELFDYLLGIAESVYDRVIYEKGDFQSGICRIRQERCIFLNRNLNLDINLRILAEALEEEWLLVSEMPPAVQRAIMHYTDKS